MKFSEWLANSDTSQSELARGLGITQGRVSQLVAGAQPSLELAMRIAVATGHKVKPQDFREGDMTSKLDSVEEAIKAIGNGDMVVVVDDDDRENEGDLIAAAAKITPEQMAFMVRHTSGIVCAPITAEDARRLKLDPMVALNDAPMGTAFTVTIDYKEGLTTGISAKERCATVHALANKNVQAGDFVRPGHVFPLVAKSGGVLMRSGHTEAAVDLVKLAGLHPAGVICELVNDDGIGQAGTAGSGLRPRARLEDHLGRRSHRLSPVARAAGRADGAIRRRDADRHGAGLFLCDALRRGGAAGAGLRRYFRRQERSGAPASGECAGRCVRQPTDT